MMAKIFPALLTLVLSLSAFSARADDCESIRQNIKNLPVSGGEVKVSAGTFNCDSAIIIDRSNVQLRGAGSVLSILRLSDNIHSPLLIIGARKTIVDKNGNYVAEHRVSDIEVSGLSFDGNRANHDPKKECGEKICDGDPLSVRNNGITIRGASKILIENVVAHSTISGGMVTEKYCDHLTVRNFTSYNNYFDGFAGYETEHSLFSNLYLHHNRNAGISIDINFSNNVIEDSRLHDNGDVGIFARDLHGNHFNRLSILRSGSFGLFFAAAHTPGSCARDNTFTALTVNDSKNAGFRLNDSCPGNRIEGASDLCQNLNGGISQDVPGTIFVGPEVLCP